jgi:putative two-component system hydrogenase maturation factor HypX/HoxX
MRPADREFSWSDSTDTIIRHISTADGSPGVRATLGGATVAVFDAHRGPPLTGRPGSIVGRRHGAVLVRTGDGAIWIGHVRAEGAVKLPATMALRQHLVDVPEVLPPVGTPKDGAGRRELHYERHGAVGVLHFDFYNGAMSTGQCRRLVATLRHAIRQPTKVLVIRGGDVFSNGIHLNVIHAAALPAVEAWRNITAIDDVCREIIVCPRQLVVASVGANAGAGGVMMALGADQVILRDGVVLNPHYRTMGLYGSEYWTSVLPRRVGADEAAKLTEQCLPIGAQAAARIGLVDDVLAGRPAEFESAVLEHASRLAGRDDYPDLLRRRNAAREADERRKPIEAYRAEELAEMSRDIFDDRNSFSAARHAFVTKQKPTATPGRIASHRALIAQTVDTDDVAIERAS